jgi:DNA-binding NarL/FixJ family response regulator
MTRVEGIMKTRILIVDDHALFRDGLKMLIDHESDMEVVGEAENGEVAIERARELRPDIILMDVKMPVMDGVEATRHIKAEMPGMKILALSMYSSDGFLSRMMNAGALGYFMKGNDFQELSGAIRKAMGTKSSQP